MCNACARRERIFHALAHEFPIIQIKLVVRVPHTNVGGRALKSYPAFPQTNMGTLVSNINPVFPAIPFHIRTSHCWSQRTSASRLSPGAPGHLRMATRTPGGSSRSPRRANEFQRVYKACEPCRRKKIRCVPDDSRDPPGPPCLRCRRELKECVFSTERSTRRRQARRQKANSAYGRCSVWLRLPTPPEY